MKSTMQLGVVDEYKTSDSPFAVETTSATTAVRKALNDMIAALPGDIHRARDLEQVLGLDYKLCWRIFNVIRANDLLAAANHVPKPPSIKRILTAAQKQGVSAVVLDTLRDAAGTFDRVVHDHAGDRAAFDSMVAGVASPGDGQGQIDPVERRNAYRANSHIWGLQTDTFASALLVRASGSGEGIDECGLTMRLGLKRFRAGARTVAFRYSYQSLEESGKSNQQALDPDAERIYGAALLPNFCSSPMPQFKRVDYGDGCITHELVDNAVGLRSSVDQAFGVVIRNDQYARDGDRRLVFSGANFTSPVASLVSDLIVHRPSFGKVSPELMVFQSMPGDDSPEVARRAQKLPVRASIIGLGRGINVMSTPEVPRYTEMLAYACQKLGWDPNEFDVYRVNIAYPVLNSVVRLQFYVD